MTNTTPAQDERSLMKQAIKESIQIAFISKRVPFTGEYADSAYEDLADAFMRNIDMKCAHSRQAAQPTHRIAPVGWKLMPPKSTQLMVATARARVMHPDDIVDIDMQLAYETMFAVAPDPAQSAPSEGEAQAVAPKHGQEPEAWKRLQALKNPYTSQAEAHVWDMAIIQAMRTVLASPVQPQATQPGEYDLSQADVMRTANAQEVDFIGIARATLSEPQAQPSRNDVLEGVIRAGGGLSNIAFNLAQQEGMTLGADHCKSMDDSRRAWDAAIRTMKDQPSKVTGEE